MYTRELTYRCFYILPIKAATQKMQMSEYGGLIEVNDDFYVGNVDSVSHCPTLKSLNNSGCLFSSADSHFKWSKPTKGTKFRMSESSIC